MAEVPSPPAVDCNSQAAYLKKRKRSSSTFHILTAQEKHARIDALTKELQGLFDYYREFMAQGLQLLASDECGSAHAAISRFLEESDLPFSNLVDHIYAKIKDNTVLHGQVLTLASVKSAVLLVGQRIAYGLQTADADILEDNASSSLWCWETREMKMLPKTLHPVIKVRRTCRKKIHERVSAISEMLTALKKPDHDPNYQNCLVEASKKLHKVLHEADIRLLMDGLMQRNLNNGGAEKEAKRDEKAHMKQLEKQKREEEKEKKRMERELQKEKVKNEKELKRLQEEAEKEQRRREREEHEMNKQLRRQQEEAEKDQRRREKEETERKKQLAMQKQASIMERFLKKAKASSSMQNEAPSTSVPFKSDSNCVRMAEAVTSSIDSALHSNQEKSPDAIRKSHLSSWHSLGLSMRRNRKHWGIRQKPKTELLKELKLTTNTAKVPPSEDEMNIEKLVDGLEGRTIDADLCRSSPDRMHTVKMCKRRKQLLQFDKSHRPAFYGIWPTRSCVVGPRRPLRKDPELDYEVDSDEEWEEEDPGESLSDCEKDEESLEECSKVDEEDESEDGFFVPDGYLSENEGVQVDRMETDPTELARTPFGDQDVESEELSAFFRQQKYLNTATEHALRKNQPLIIINLMHEKGGVVQSNPENLSGNAKLEYMCLQALSMRGFPGSIVEISAEDEDEDAYLSGSSSKNSGAAALTPGKNVRAAPDLDLPTIVSTIRACRPQGGGGINNVVESLQQKFPAVPKSQLRNKVRQVSDFVDNRWQVKKEVLDKLGLSGSPESSGGRTKSIAAFFSKRCMPPAVKRINPDEMS